MSTLDGDSRLPLRPPPQVKLVNSASKATHTGLLSPSAAAFSIPLSSPSNFPTSSLLSRPLFGGSFQSVLRRLFQRTACIKVLTESCLLRQRDRLPTIMDPLSIVASSFGLAGGIAKASMALHEFSRDFKDCKDDVDKVSNEVQALAGILDPLVRTLSRTQNTPIFEALAPKVDTTIAGCSSVIDQLLVNLQNISATRPRRKPRESGSLQGRSEYRTPSDINYCWPRHQKRH
ncbi:hypothetical protein B0J13DRAFT_531871 [Dactylonectria estremocensis]|uniref:Azaphilone pigments biosynthesis cluster protein L N-terminal domain-containing protein n=1 Tax=Dactylonectria estremocensis TaxID=1079267 RepID=A0A9P9DMM0_9HYPO|nr:hypothetical protein B0J13DRAFT_531871 [Dactylonectria estremocensis]